METATMGKVLVSATIENLGDLYEVLKGQRKPEDVRRVEVTDALVDTGATELGPFRGLLYEEETSPHLAEKLSGKTLMGPATLAGRLSRSIGQLLRTY